MIEIRTAALVSDINTMEVQVPLSWIVIPLALTFFATGLFLLYADMKAYGEYMRRDRDYFDL